MLPVPLPQGPGLARQPPERGGLRRQAATLGAQRDRLNPARRAEPRRTCVGCRVEAARSELLRVVVVDGELLPDARRQMPGRGANVHPVPACLDIAERRRAFPRALRVCGPLRLDRLRAHVVEGCDALAAVRRA